MTPETSVETEADIRFSPALGRYVRIALQTQVYWGAGTWPGFAIGSQPPVTNVNLKYLAKTRIYGISGANAQAIADAVNVERHCAGSGVLAARFKLLSGRTGRRVRLPLLLRAATNSYPGTLFVINDLSWLAPNYATTMNNISSGLLPSQHQCDRQSGREAVHSSWPYRSGVVERSPGIP